MTKSGVPSIEDLKALQRRLGLLDVHVCWIGPSWYVVAHTDPERALAAKHPAAMPLEDCALHQWLHGLDGPPVSEGYYVVIPHEADAYSEPYGADPWDFKWLDESAFSPQPGDRTGAP